MGKRKYTKDKADKIKIKIRKLERKLKRQEEESTGSSEERTPPGSPVAEVSPPGSPIREISSDEIISEDLLGALGPEGQEIQVKGKQIQQQLATRWTKIIAEGLERESRESILKKYPLPENFPGAEVPEINPEILVSLSDTSIKRDKRITARQNQLGKIMFTLGKTLTSILRGEINSKMMVEEINDAAKLAADIYHDDTVSRKFFALSNTTTTVKEAIKEQKPDKFLFGVDCGDRIRSAQTIQKTGNQIKINRRNRGNWKSPLPPPQQPRSGQYPIQTQRTRNYNTTFQRKSQYPFHSSNQQQSQKIRVNNPPPQRKIQKQKTQTTHRWR